MHAPLTRRDALAELERYGITGKLVYLIDIIPLIEMIWADGSVQDVERDLLDKFLAQHVANINALAGMELIDMAAAKGFADKLLADRPDPKVMTILHRLIPIVRMSSSDAERNAHTRAEILRWCLDIGASCVREYPYGDHDRFSDAEKACFEEIFTALV